MSFVNKTIRQFIDEVDSKSPTPGGGSVSALSAVLGVSLARMVCHVTIGRKAFLKLDEEQQQEILTAFEALGVLKEDLLPLIDEDTQAFNKIMDAYRLPKETTQQELLRHDAIEKATIGAIEVPLQVALLSLQALKTLAPIAKYGNKNAISDVGVAAQELHTAVVGALMNVEINVSGLSDVLLQEKYQQQVETNRQSLFEELSEVMHIVQKHL